MMNDYFMSCPRIRVNNRVINSYISETYIMFEGKWLSECINHVCSHKYCLYEI